MTVLQRSGARSGRQDATQAERPLLARVAEHVFWCSRYVERAEHIARTTLITSQLATDAGDLDAWLRERLWHGLLEAFDVKPPIDDEEPGWQGRPLGDRVLRHLVASPDNALGACPAIARARDNARNVRGEVSLEMWQTINELYWSLEGAGGMEGARDLLAESAEGLLDHVIRGSMLFQGVTDQTLAHGRRWDFAVLGRMLERADATCRILQARVKLLDEAGESLETPLRNIQLMAALRMCCSIEAYRRQHLNELSISRVVGFMLLRADHPRSVRFAVDEACRAASRIRADAGQRSGGGHVDAAERLLGRLAAHLEFADDDEVAAGGLGLLLEVRRAVAAANHALHDRYFAL